MTLHLGYITSDLSLKHGWGAYSLHLLNALQQQGVNVTVIAARNSDDAPNATTHKLLPTVSPRERFTLPKLFAASPRASALLQSCDVIHSTIEPYAPLAALVAGRRPLLVTGHGSYVQLNQHLRFPANQVYQWAFRRGLLVCVSRYTAKIAQESIAGIRTAVVNNGVQLERFANLPAPTPQPRPIVLTVGAIKARKGTLALVRAMAKVREHIPNVHSVIIGNQTAEPAYVAQVRAEIDRLNLQETVSLMGYLSDAEIEQWYSAANVFVLPSINDGWRFEGYGLALIDASAAGLPVVGTLGCGAEDAVDDGETGFLVPQDRIDDTLPNAIMRLLTNADLARQMGDAGRAKAQRNTWAHVANQMIDLYTEELRR